MNATEAIDQLINQMEHRQSIVAFAPHGGFEAYCTCSHVEVGRTMGGATANLVRFHIAMPTCPQCHGPISACGYDVDNDICPERERMEADR